MKNNKIKPLYKAQGIHVFFLIVFCAACFMIGVRFYDIGNQYFFSHNNNSENISSEIIVSFPSPYVPDLGGPLIVKNIVDTGLKPSIDTDNPQNKDSIYKTTRANIISKYDSGKRDRETIQSFLYLTSLENNTSRYQEVASEWCQKNESECIGSKNTVTFSGIIKDDLGKPIPGVEVFVSGDENTHTFSSEDGSYLLSFLTLNPRRIRIVLRHDGFSGGSHTVVTLDPILTNETNQIFKKDFILTKPTQEIIVNTSTRKIITGNAEIDNNGFLITNDFSKYYIPFGSIKKQDRTTYKGLVKIKVFEFNRETANEFLTSDVFDDIHGFASEGLKTYSMPLIFFYDTAGNRLEVFQDNPMTVWTTNRELNALIEEMSVRPNMPGFNPDEYDEGASPENVAKKVKEDEEKAYTESQKNINSYPITHAWLLENFSRLPGFFVFDQSTGMWENTGFSLIAHSTDVQYSIKSLFWTKK